MLPAIATAFATALFAASAIAAPAVDEPADLDATPADNGQQKWAAAFLNWTTDPPNSGIQVLDQEIWVPMLADNFEWTIQWNFNGSKDATGYLGFNTDDRGRAQMLFSLWNATDSEDGPNSACRKFDGEGKGLSCRQRFELRGNRIYRLHIERGAVTAEGTWWSASITEEQPPAAPGQAPAPSVVVALGSLRVAAGFNDIMGSNLINFIEYWGDKVARCDALPVSALYAAPPQANPDAGTGQYTVTARFAPTTGYDECKLGTEPIGASYRGGAARLISQAWPMLYPVAPSSDGGLVFLGDATGTRTLMDNFSGFASGIRPPPMAIFIAAPAGEQ